MAAGLYWTLTVLLIVVLVVSALLAYQTATRLDRLHVRYDLSWQALDGALARRAVVARAVAADTYRGRPEGKRLAALADAAERAPRSGREAAENELSAALAMVDPTEMPVALVAELADAEARVLLARRFHNDAVRDTLALRERRPVRWLRLGGTAPLPSYFEIAERGDTAPADTAEQVDRRTSARVVLLDERGAVLLFCGSDPAVTGGVAPRWWFTVGGQALPGERLVDAAVREIAEETGLRVDPAQMVGPVWRRDSLIDFNGAVLSSQEFYFVHRTARFEPTAAGRTQLELRYIHGHRWCDSATIDQLAAAGQTVYPLQLGELLVEANRLADGHGGEAAKELHPIR
ncbi:NUDIX domain-containing protein [Mycobacterium sp. CVI_P3]|uniref:NUDIX domain-containing protein n=1 Tax=Mycobacterium pinniadriaticum TaxID=2994102 RepID=A0ABT3SIM1_9MYCO|nr:NUDIX domain-containing protein [Mycobacterium pinniadriaticum]MCX2932885.1 NUDIX domain-containing protein [Mycobacterium pinniadriaticum]MCX2939308.1 NUDIX domain-containing protein [Mycobacterium pinniadriaticum]